MILLHHLIHFNSRCVQIIFDRKNLFFFGIQDDVIMSVYIPHPIKSRIQIYIYKIVSVSTYFLYSMMMSRQWNYQGTKYKYNFLRLLQK